MDTPRQVVLLSIFGAVGIALAIGVGVTVSPPNDRPGPNHGPHGVAVNRVIEGGAAANPGGQEGVDPGASGERLPPPAASADGDQSEAGRQDGRSTVRVEETAEELAGGTVRLTPPSFSRPDRPRPLAGATAPYGVAPSPAYGQLSLQGLLGEEFSERMKQVNELLRRQEGAQEASRAEEDPVRRGGPGVGPSATAQGRPGLSAMPPKSSIRAEDDGELTIRFQNEDIRKVLELLSAQGALNILSSPNVQGTVSATLSNVDLETALEAILRSSGYQAKRDGKFIFVGTAQDFTNLEQSLDSVGTRIYRPNYVSAAELQQLITPLLTAEVGIASVSSPSEVGMDAQATAAGGDAFAGAEAVVVRDSEAVLVQIDKLVAQVDVRPMQIHIEAMILSVSLKDSDEFGVNFQFLRDQGNVKFGAGEPFTTLADLDFTKGSLKLGFLDSSLGAFLEALETVGDTDVIATPRLMALNKQPARIQIGDQKGYISTTVTETTATETVEFLETGTILQLRPYISSDGIVRLEIHPELSTGEVKEKGEFTLPEKQVTEVTTNVMIRDGCTVIIGGLMRDELATTKNQIPWLGNLPLVGFAFRNTTETIERHEVLVLLTPHIVYEPGPCREGSKAAAEFHRRHQVMLEKTEPFNRTHVARRYLRLARSAWSRGDRATALRFAEMAVEFNPTSREAIDLRSDIWLGRGHGDHPLTASPTVEPDGGGDPAAALDQPDLSPWLLDRLRGGESAGVGVPTHPIDPGIPGPKNSISKPSTLE